MSVHALVPVKALREAKTRLAAVLTFEQRARLTLTMLHTVCRALRQAAESRDVRSISIVTSDATLVPEGCARIDDAGFGLNAALAAAAEQLVRGGAQALLILPADLPFVRASDVRALCAWGSERPALAIAPDRARRGTNGLLLTPPQLIAPRFGAESFAAHAAAGRAAGVTAAVPQCPGLECDIDDPADLELLLHREPQAYSFLQPPREAIGS